MTLLDGTGLSTVAAEPLPAQLQVETPAGILGFNIVLSSPADPDGSFIATSENVSEVRLLQDDLGRWMAWGQGAAEWRAELLIIRPEFTPREVDHFGLDDIWIAYLAVEALTTCEVSFSARWQPGFGWHDGGWDTGEGMTAMTWTGPGALSHTLGTHDEDVLQARVGRSLPKSWAKYFPPDEYPWYRAMVRPLIDESSRTVGLAIAASSLKHGERCLLHFAVAWKEIAHDQDIGPWLAADEAPYDRGAGLRGRLFLFPFP